MGLNSIDTRLPPRKKIVSATVLLWYMGLGECLIRLDSHRKKNLATVLLWFMGLIKTQLPFDPHRKKIISFPATVYCMGLEKNQSHGTIIEKNNIFVSDNSTSVVHRT